MSYFYQAMLSVNKLVFVLTISILIFSSCTRADERDATVKNGDKYKRYMYWWTPVLNRDDLLVFDIELFKNTPAWKLAKAVYEQDTQGIARICHENSSLTSVKDDIAGITLLQWAVFNYRYFSAKALLEGGADPNAHLGVIGTPFMTAASKNETANYLKLFLKFGGNVNDTVQHMSTDSGQHTYFIVTPLHKAATSNLESTKILVEAGANINVSDSDNSILSWAVLHDNIQILYYLIQKGADFRTPAWIADHKVNYALDFIKDKKYIEGSEDYTTWQKVLKFLREHGADSTYQDNPVIPN